MKLIFCCSNDSGFLENDSLFCNRLLAGGRRAGDNLVLDLHDGIAAHD